MDLINLGLLEPSLTASEGDGHGGESCSSERDGRRKEGVSASPEEGEGKERRTLSALEVALVADGEAGVKDDEGRLLPGDGAEEGVILVSLRASKRSQVSSALGPDSKGERREERRERENKLTIT